MTILLTVPRGLYRKIAVLWADAVSSLTFDENYVRLFLLSGESNI